MEEGQYKLSKLASGHLEGTIFSQIKQIDQFSFCLGIKARHETNVYIHVTNLIKIGSKDFAFHRNDTV